MNEHLDLAITLASSRNHGDPWPAYLIGSLWLVFMVVVIGRKALQARRRHRDQQATLLNETYRDERDGGGS